MWPVGLVVFLSDNSSINQDGCKVPVQLRGLLHWDSPLLCAGLREMSAFGVSGGVDKWSMEGL